MFGKQQKALAGADSKFECWFYTLLYDYMI